MLYDKLVKIIKNNGFTLEPILEGFKMNFGINHFIINNVYLSFYKNDELTASIRIDNIMSIVFKNDTLFINNVGF